VFESSDEQLVQKALKGNKNAWYSLLSSYEKAIYNYAIRMTGNSHDAADLMQEIFLSVFNSLASYKGTGSFKAWLFRIAHFRSMDFFRRKRPDLSLDDIGAEQGILESSSSQSVDLNKPLLEASPEQHLQSGQSQQQILSLMQTLPLKQRTVIELKFFSQFTFDEIAGQLDISSNTVKSRLYAALAVLKTKMEVEHGH
jgi:RNA polymerase sigma-70 factor (ECF subfamily)